MNLGLLPFSIDMPDTVPLATAQKTVAPGDTVERTIKVTNESSERDSVLATLTAIDPDRRSHIDESNGAKTISVDPGESREVTLSWTPDEEVPEGNYDLIQEVWAETDLENRTTQLDERTESDAITVEKPDGTLSVSTSPQDATVIVDGEILESSSVKHSVGTYDVTAIHSEFGSATESVTIREGETTTVELDLENQIKLGEYEPQDTTGDGLYNDVNGDGQTTHGDVNVLFEYIESDAVQNNPEKFDFDENGQISFSDVLALLRRI